jgi:hypothetical protein
MADIFGTNNNDNILGTRQSDSIFGLAGNDTISGDNGSDILDGGTGNDNLFGGNATDTLRGGTDNDNLDGGNGNDVLLGDPGNDVLSGQRGDDIVFGGRGQDNLFGGSGDDQFVISRGTGSATLANADVIEDFGQGGDSIGLIGNLTFDQLNIFQGTGANANDTIIIDNLTGQFLAVLKNVNSNTIDARDFVASQLQDDIAIENGSFEANFTGWATTGNATIQTSSFGVAPTDGTQQALLSSGGNTVSDSSLEAFLGLSSGSLDGLGNGNATQGSAIRQTFTANAGEVINFNWNFLTDEFTPTFFNDFSFVAITPVAGAIELADTNSSFVSALGTGFFEQTGYQSFSFTIPTSGTYVLGLGVVDVSDTVVDSGLLVDNVTLV